MIIGFLRNDSANLFSFVKTIVLFTALCVLFCYTSDTKIIAAQTEEQNLRPVILQAGFLSCVEVASYEKAVSYEDKANMQGAPPPKEETTIPKTSLAKDPNMERIKDKNTIIDFLRNDYANLFSFLNIIVLIFTLRVLLRYASDTKIIAAQTEEKNLRPVILRAGYFKSWEALVPYKGEAIDPQSKKGNSPTMLAFSITKNIATDIQGHVVINGYKYKLYFGNKIAKVADSTYAHMLSWGWMGSDTEIFAYFTESTKEKTEEKNQIYIHYKDIEGNEFCTVEDRHHSQKSFRLGKPSSGPKKGRYPV